MFLVSINIANLRTGIYNFAILPHKQLRPIKN